MPPRTIKINRDQIRVLSNATRLEIHTSLRTDGPATAKDLAERLGQDEMRLYYHLRLLDDNGLLTTQTRPGATKPETVYSVTARFLVEDFDLTDKKNLEEQCRNVDSLLRRVSREQREAATTLRNAMHDHSSIGRLAVRLDKKNFKELRRKLKELSEWLDDNNKPSGERYSFSFFAIPLPDESK